MILHRFKHSARRILLRAILTSWLQRIVGAVSGLITIPILVGDLGTESYGIWILIGQVVTFMVLTDLGGTNVLGRLVARCRGLEDHDAMEQLLSTTMAILTGAGVLVALLTVVFAFRVPSWIGVPESSSDIARTIFLILGWSLALQFPLRVGQGLLVGYQLYGYDGLSKIVDALLRLVAILFLHQMRLVTLINVALLNAAISLFTQGLLTIIVWWMTRPWRLSLRKLTSKWAREIVSIGSSAVVTTASNLTYTSGIGIAIGRMLGVEAVGIYGVAYSIMSNVYPLISALCTPFVSLASEWHARQQRERLRNVSMQVMKIAFLMAICAAALISICGESFLRFVLVLPWSDIEFRQAGLAMSIMCVGMAIGLPQLISRATLQGTGQHWRATIAILLASVISIMAGIIAMRHGADILGAALSRSLFWALQSTILMPAICRFLKQPLKEMLVTVYAIGVGIGAIFFLIVSRSFAWIAPHNIPTFLMAMVPGGILSVVVIYFFGGMHRMLWSGWVRATNRELKVS